MANTAPIFPTNSLASAPFRSMVRASHAPNVTMVRASHAPNVPSNAVNRRNLSLGLAAATFLGISGGDGSARAAGRRAPPPPPTEKVDPSLSSLQAKILASKRRKEAMKQEIAKLRLKGKIAQDTPSTPNQVTEP